MNILNITARDLSEAWFLCLKGALTSSREYIIDRGSYVGQRRKEIEFVVVDVLHPGTRPLVPDVPIGVPAPSTMDYVEDYLPYLMTNTPKENEQYTYGAYLEKQIAEVIRIYKEDGFNTNQACMAVGDAGSIYLSDPPCLRQIDTRISQDCSGYRNGNPVYGVPRLHFYVYFRSWDLWAGFPPNLAAIQLLKEYVASEIGVEDGELVACSKGLHLYEYAWKLADMVLKR